MKPQGWEDPDSDPRADTQAVALQYMPTVAALWQPTSDPMDDLKNFEAAAALDSMDRASAQTVRDMTPLMEELARSAREISAWSEKVAAPTDEPPSDPMARALWLRQRRNTGPSSHRLDGRRRRR